MLLFDKVCYHISETIPERTRNEIVRILEANGAAKTALDHATHAISDTIDFERANALKKGAACVTPYWVERSMELGTLQDPKYFSADKELIFSGIVASSAGIPPGDKEVIAAGIKESGGQWREGLTRDVTHLFVTNTSSQKYETAMHFRDSVRITVLLPQWFDQCWSMQIRLPSDVFEFPDPPYMRKDHDVAAYKAQMLMNKNAVDDTGKPAMFRALKNMDPSSPSMLGHTTSVPTRNIWQKRAILLSSSLGLDVRRREFVEARIRCNGGVVVAPDASDKDETAAVGLADVLVTQYRTGAAYAHALAEGKVIGTLAWFFFVERSGVVSSPRDQLLHYPVRNKPIEGFEHHEITVTNYQGDERDYLKKLIEIMGAKFTPTMSGRNTIVIAAYKGGNKTAKAEEWSVPVVTHKWLEDCFVEWRNLTPAQKKYLDYAPGVNYGTVLGERGVGRTGLEEDQDLSPEGGKLQNSKDTPPFFFQEGKAQKPRANEPLEDLGNKNDAMEGPTATATSLREVREVEDALNVGGDIEYVDGLPPPANGSRGPESEQPFTPNKVGPPRSIKRSPNNSESTIKLKLQKTAKLTSVRGRSDDASPPSRKRAEDKSIEECSSSSEDGASHKSKSSTRMTEKGRDNMQTKSPVAPRQKQKFNSVSRKRRVSASAGELDTDEDEPTVIRKEVVAREALVCIEGDTGTVTTKPRPKSRLREERARKQTTGYESDKEIVILDERPPRSLNKKIYQTRPKAGSKRTATHKSEPGSDSSVQELPAKNRGVNGPKVDVSKTKHKATLPHTRMVSVEIPEARSLLPPARPRAWSPERSGSGVESKSGSSSPRLSPTRSKQKSVPLSRTTSVRAAAQELQSPEKLKRYRLAGGHDQVEPRSPTPLPRRAGATKAEGASSSSHSSPLQTTPSSIQRISSRRTAAAAASRKLRDEVMPDVINYENEVKRRGNAGRKRKTSSKIGFDNDEDGDSESSSEVREKKKQKFSNLGRRKGSRKGELDDLGGPPAKFITHVPSIERPVSVEDDDESAFHKHNSQSGARQKIRAEVYALDEGSESDTNPPRQSDSDPKKIRVLTTKVTIREEVCQRLAKLGVKFTEKPSQCTHLVASSFARTEKFLCALSNAPFVLSTSWLLESSAKKMILVESDYLLKDSQMEEKHNFKLTEALERAREMKKKKEKLMQGQFFYFTPNIPVDFNLIKNVIQTNGAECIQKTPTIRNLSSTRHIISSEKDEKLWRPLAKQGFPIYSPELILTAACAQFVDWDGVNKRVPGSF